MNEPTYEVKIRLHRGRSNVSDNFAQWEAEQVKDFVNSCLRGAQKTMPYCRAVVTTKERTAITPTGAKL